MPRAEPELRKKDAVKHQGEAIGMSKWLSLVARINDSQSSEGQAPDAGTQLLLTDSVP